MSLICKSGAKVCDGCGACGEDYEICQVCRQKVLPGGFYDILGQFICTGCLEKWAGKFLVKK